MEWELFLKKIKTNSSGTKFKIHDYKLNKYDLMTIEDNKNTQDSCWGCYKIHTWHKMRGHCNYDDIIKLPDIIDGMKIKGRGTNNKDCEICTKRKFSQSRNRKPDTQTTSILQLVNTDLDKPIEPADSNGNRYDVSFTNEFSGTVFIYLATEKFITDSSPNGKIKTLRSDNGLEFKSNNFQSLRSRNNIKNET